MDIFFFISHKHTAFPTLKDHQWGGEASSQKGEIVRFKIAQLVTLWLTICIHFNALIYGHIGHIKCFL